MAVAETVAGSVGAMEADVEAATAERTGGDGDGSGDGDTVDTEAAAV